MRQTGTWGVVIPVKCGAYAKSRLSVPRVSRATLALAMAVDTVAAARAALTGPVLVVTSDRRVAQDVRSVGACVLADPGRGLAEAVAAGLDALPAGARAVLLGDLPALRPADLLAALAACAHHERAFVPDRPGTGTVLLTARAGSAPVPRFGEGSAAAHDAAGHTRVDLDLPSLRTDVDDVADLAAARILGVGPRTREALAAAR